MQQNIKTFIITGSIDGKMLESIYTVKAEKLTREIQLDAMKHISQLNPDLLGIKYDIRITNQPLTVIDAIGKFYEYKDGHIFIGDVIVENIHGFREMKSGAHDRDQYYWGNNWKP
jgi:hypothetical protein